MTGASKNSSMREKKVDSIEDLLQSQTALIVSLQASFLDSCQRINRKMDDVMIELKGLKAQMNDVASDKGSKVQIDAWRSHAEHILQMQSKNQEKEVKRMIELLRITNVEKKSLVSSATSTSVSPQQKVIATPELSAFQFVKTPPSSCVPSSQFTDLFAIEKTPSSGDDKKNSKEEVEPNIKSTPLKNPFAVPPVFGFTHTPLKENSFRLFSPANSVSVTDLTTGSRLDETNAEEANDEEAEEFVPNVHFEPVIPLPELIEVKTGEEDEEIMFVSRCKLYRYDRDVKENKERGLGEIKVLKNKVTSKYRVIMRRDQTLKLCANFAVSPGMKFSQKANYPAVYTWACKDFSEDSSDGIDEIFLARFKNSEVAANFSKELEVAAGNIEP